MSIPEMPDRLEAAGIKRVEAPRIRQLAATDDFPRPVYERGRLRLWDWAAVLAFFGGRTLRQGERTDLKRSAQEESTRGDQGPVSGGDR
ncbi:hypothetical protein [Actinacidiphila acididurans]|uniref:DNA-binding protein n=1 Tax=Actinacidiphila acididurans TaxID=2784346 RepID=A0ABS2TWS9_9ACTN|nr:hypothetical protein [Actinacidiphila acididurans]MBM9506735.1 hypothetical protein [Actinacidiphila acididurans]